MQVPVDEGMRFVGQLNLNVGTYFGVLFKDHISPKAL